MLPLYTQHPTIIAPFYTRDPTIVVDLFLTISFRNQLGCAPFLRKKFTVLGWHSQSPETSGRVVRELPLKNGWHVFSEPSPTAGRDVPSMLSLHVTGELFTRTDGGVWQSLFGIVRFSFRSRRDPAVRGGWHGAIKTQYLGRTVYIYVFMCCESRGYIVKESARYARFTTTSTLITV